MISRSALRFQITIVLRFEIAAIAILRFGHLRLCLCLGDIAIKNATICMGALKGIGAAIQGLHVKLVLRFAIYKFFLEAHAGPGLRYVAKTNLRLHSEGH